MRLRIANAALFAAGIATLLPALALAAPRAADVGLASSAAQRASSVSGPPEISAPASVSASSDQFVSIEATATDPDAGDVLTITASGAPASLSLAASPSVSPATATLSGTLGADNVGSYLIDWTVTSSGGSTAATTTTLGVAENAPPILDAPAAVSGAETIVLSFGVNLSDADGDAANSLTATGLPAGAAFTPNVFLTSGIFSWTPPLGSQGVYNVTFNGSTGSPARTATAATTITIGPRDRFPVITGVPGTINTVTSIEVAVNPVVSDPDGDPISSLICRGTQNTPLPAGAVFTPNANNTGGAFRWTPTPAQSGTVTLDFIATSGPLNLTTIVICKIVVKIDRAPAVTAPASVSGSENSPVAFSVTASDPDATPIASLTASGLPAGANFTPNGANTSGAFAWTPSYSQAGSHPVVFTASNALSGSATTNLVISNVDLPPTVSAPAAVAGNEGAPIHFVVSAADADGDAIASLAAVGLPAGASFTAGPGNKSGAFDWTPGFADAGAYPILFQAANALNASASTTITVENQNRGPLAAHGGPYTGVAGIPIAFDGSGSADPDGDALTYAWSFGDGTNAAGVAPSHTYAAGGAYAVVLTVTDDGSPSLSDDAATNATITSVYPARLFTTNANGTIRLGSGKPVWCLQLEAVDNGFSLGAVSVPSIVLKYGAGEIHAAAGKTLFSGDTDGNAVPELNLCFGKGDLRTLLADLPSGRTTVTLQITGELITGAQISGSITIDVTGGGGGAQAASVSPNPLNPEATLTLSTSKAGALRVRIFDAAGRLVRTIADLSNAAPGYHDFRIDGRDARGIRLGTGVYFYRAETPDGVLGGRFTILK